MPGLQELGTLRHTRGVQVPPCALMAAKNLSRPACIQDIEHQEPKLPAEAHKTPGYKLQRCKNMLAQQMERKTYPQLRQDLCSVGTGLCCGARCCTDKGTKVALLLGFAGIGFPFSERSQQRERPC